MENTISPARLVLTGLNFRTTPLEIRERLACCATDLPQDWRGRDDRFSVIQELVILSTCNRVELIALINCPGLDAQHLLADLLALLTGVNPVEFIQQLYFCQGEAAVRHLFRVATGLDSQVLGEPQILGQVSQAFTEAQSAQIIGSLFNELGRVAVRCGRRARNETKIDQNPVSTSSMAVAQAQSILGDLASRRHLIIGAGEMAQLALKSLKHRGVNSIAIANRNRQRAEALAAAEDLRVCDFSELSVSFSTVDLVISATSAARPILTRQMVETYVEQRSDHPLVIIDIAVPRDVEPAIGQLPGVTLFDADDLQQGLDDALASRRAEIPAIEAIIDKEIENFLLALRGLALRPVIVDLRQKAESIRQKELERALRYLGDLDPDALNHLNQFSRALVNKLLHEPTLNLRDRAIDENAAVYANTVRELFGLKRVGKNE